MIWLEILFLVLFIISFLIYKRNWIPRYPPFYSKKVLIKIGHRGAPLLAHENTLASFKKAVLTKMNGIELDVQYSSDEKLVVYHDWDLINTLGEKKQIRNMPYSEILKIKLNNKETNKIPLFSEVLEILPKNYIVVIEIKSLYFYLSVPFAERFQGYLGK